MRRNQVGPAPGDHGSENGWEVAHLRGGTALDGVRMAGFRDRASVGLDMQALPQPVVVVVIGLGDDPLTVESATAHRPLRSFVAALSPGPARIRGENVTCVEVCLPPLAAHAVLGVSPRELDGSVNGLEDLWGRHARLLREQLTDATTWQERLALTDTFLAKRAAAHRRCRPRSPPPGTPSWPAAAGSGSPASPRPSGGAVSGCGPGSPTRSASPPSAPPCWSASTTPHEPSARARAPTPSPSRADTPTSPTSTATSRPWPGARRALADRSTSAG